MSRVYLPPLLFFLVSYFTVVDDMDELTRNGITPSLSKSEIMEALSKLPTVTINPFGLSCLPTPKVENFVFLPLPSWSNEGTLRCALSQLS